MVITIAHSASNNQANLTNMDEYSDKNSDISSQNLNARNNYQQMIDC